MDRFGRRKRFLIQVKGTGYDEIRIDKKEIKHLIDAGKKSRHDYAYAIRFYGGRWRVFRRGRCTSGKDPNRLW
jgi:Holliday junction resolvase